MTYEMLTDEMRGSQVIKRTDADGTVWFIPMVEGNSDYQAYLAYVANGNKTPTIQ